jgi:hypothetical protein
MLNLKIIGFILLVVGISLLLFGGISLILSNHNYPLDALARIEGKNSVRYRERRKSVIEICFGVPLGVFGFILFKKSD